MSQPETKPLMNIFKRGKRFLLGMQRLSTVSRRLAKLEKKRFSPLKKSGK